MVTYVPLSPVLPRETWRPDELLPQYLEAVRLCLDGAHSPLDWYRLSFTDAPTVRRFLDVNRTDPDDPFDRARFDYLLAEAVAYVRRHFGYRFPPEVVRPRQPEDLFLLASGDRPSKTQVLACVVLKLMHVINHLEARSLLHETAVSERELERQVEHRLMGAARAMMAEGVPITTFYGNRKSRDATITKLLVKRDVTAADILDRVRFRVVTASEEDIVHVLAHLLRHVLPFNHVLARESVNNLVDLDRWIARQPGLRHLATALLPTTALLDRKVNEFSAGGYRSVNFVVDVPVRLDELDSQADRSLAPEQGRIVYVQVELQVLDQATEQRNEQGESSHEQYKERQHAAAETRLKWGLLRPFNGNGNGNNGGNGGNGNGGNGSNSRP